MTLEQEFEVAMIDLYRQAWVTLRYHGHWFLDLIGRLGGVGAARHLLDAPMTQSGFTALYLRGGINLTVEVLVQHPRWRGLFTQTQLRTAAERLAAVGYDHLNWHIDI